MLVEEVVVMDKDSFTNLALKIQQLKNLAIHMISAICIGFHQENFFINPDKSEQFLRQYLLIRS